jgi:23S rRNA pseudouridine1911/1915/1917 synthase
VTKVLKGRIGHCLATQETTLARCIAGHFGLTDQEAERLVAFGAVYVDRRRVTSNVGLLTGQYVRVHLQPKSFPVEGVDWNAVIVERGEGFLVVNKPAGVPVHPTVDNVNQNLVQQIQAAIGIPLFVTHRLDNEVGGVLVLATTRDFQRRFNRLLSDRKVHKRYRALVTSAPSLGCHVHYMEPSERGPKTVTLEPRADWKKCALEVVSITSAPGVAQAPTAFEVDIDLETGRTHQIRAQLSALGCPIVGDVLYGSETSFEVSERCFPGIALFSVSTKWSGDGGQQRSFVVSPPWR